jgi:hypothetical protein
MYSSVRDRATASLLRMSYLEPELRAGAEPLEIELNGQLKQISIEAADELIGKFVDRLRAARPGAPVIIRAKTWDVLRNVHAALRDHGQAAVAVRDSVGLGFPPMLIGDATKDEAEAFERLAAGEHVNDEATLRALGKLAEKGVVVGTPEGYALPTEAEPLTAYA